MNLKFNYSFGKEFKTGIPNRDTLAVKITKISSFVNVENVSQYSLQYGFVLRDIDNPKVFGIHLDSEGLLGYVTEYSSKKVDEFTHGAISPCLIYLYPCFNNKLEQCIKGEIRLYRYYEGEDKYVDNLVQDYFYEYSTKYYNKLQKYWEDVRNYGIGMPEPKPKPTDLYSVYRNLSDEYKKYSLPELFYLRMKKIKEYTDEFSDIDYFDIVRSFNKALCYILKNEDEDGFDKRLNIWINMMDEGEDSVAERISYNYLVEQYPEKAEQMDKYRNMKSRYFQLETCLSSDATANDKDEYVKIKSEYKQLRRELKSFGYRDNKMYSRAYNMRIIWITLFIVILIISFALVALPLLVFGFPVILKALKKVRFFN